MTHHGQRQLPAWDAAVLLGGLLLTLGCSLVFSAHRIFWSDELFGWMLLRDPSFRHMLLAWRSGADGGGLVFYLLGRVWFAVCGPSETSFRLFSAVGIYTAWVAVWLALRRQYAAWLPALMLAVVWFAPTRTVFYAIEGRFYGLLLGAAALAFFAASRFIGADQPGPGILSLGFLANLCLVGAHPLGLLYSGSLLATVVAFDAWRRRFRLIVYATVMMSWSVLLVSIEAMRNTAAVGKPHFWTLRPFREALYLAYSQNSIALRGLAYIGVLLVVVAVVTRSLNRREIAAELRSRLAVLLPAGALLLVPCVLWIKSRHGVSLFDSRYLLPVDIGEVVALTELWTLALVLPRWGRISRQAGIAIVGLLSCLSIVRNLALYREKIVIPPFDFTAALLRSLPPGVPAVFERADVVDLMLAYQRNSPTPFVYLLDWETALAPESPLGDVSGFHEMENWRTVGYFSGSIQDSARFLAANDDFVVVDDPHEKWFERRIQNHPEWAVTRLGTFDPPLPTEPARDEWRATIWRVHRIR